MIQIAPSILTCDFWQLSSQLNEIEKEQNITYLHLDIMDGVFVPNISFGPLMVESIRHHSKKILDVHLMIVQPEKYIEAFARAGANIITVHFEACTHLHRTIQIIKSFNCKVGVAINPSTPVSFLQDILHEIDLLLIMSVNPGFGGQLFIPHSLEKIKQAKQSIKEKKLNVLIEIDGGVSPQTIQSINDAGADIVVAGSSIFNTHPISDNLYKLHQALS